MKIPGLWLWKRKLRLVKDLLAGVNSYVEKDGMRAIVHKSSRPEYKYQISYFDASGKPIAHDSSNSFTRQTVSDRGYQLVSVIESLTSKGNFDPA